MVFGPFTVQSPLGKPKIVNTARAARASAYVRSVQGHARPHWRIAHRML